jgi:osmotically inducible protein OsmC
MKIFYTAVATATGHGREDGHVRSSDGIIDADIQAPVELGGKGGATNPEQLFAAGYSACFLNALRRVARRAHADVEGAEVTAEVGIGPAGEGAFGLAVTLRVTVPNVERARAEELVAAAHRVCPYSNATRGNIDVVLDVR